MTTLQGPPPQQQVVYSQTPTNSDVRENYAGSTSCRLGIIQICGGILAIAFQGALIGIKSAAGYSGAGIWCGILVCNF